MPTTDARRLANQRNAQKSTGPTTLAGKMVSRLNAMTHGLRSEAGLVPPHLSEAVAKHEVDLYAAYRPEGGHQRWLLAQVADAAARLDHCQTLMRAEVDDQMDRAELCWEQDRERAVEEIAARLPRDPGRTARRLLETAQGARWVLTRWDALSAPLIESRSWDEDQCNLAASLMGVGPDLRASYSLLSPSADPAEQAALMRDEADGVQRLLVDALEPLDAKERELTRLGFSLRPSKESLRLQRYETRLRRVWNEAMNEFRRVHAQGFIAPEPITCLEPEPDAEPIDLPALEPDPEPMLVAEPETPPSDSDSDSPGVESTVSKLKTLIQTLAADQDAPPAPSRPVPTASTPLPTRKPPMNRRARRAQTAAARKAHASTR